MSVYLEKSHRITSYEVDYKNKIKVHAILNLLQEIAQEGASKIDCGYEHLIDKNITWVLSRIKVKVHTSPVWRQEVTLKTWSKCQDGLFAIRDFEILDHQGNVLVAVSSSWLLINLVTKRINRIDNVIGDIASKSMPEKDAIVEKPSKIEAVEGAVQSKEKMVEYSDLDFNRHANNAKYPEWIFDSIDSDFLEQNEINTFELNFLNEIAVKESVSIDIAKVDDNNLFVSGKNLTTGKETFRATLEFKKL